MWARYPCWGEVPLWNEEANLALGPSLLWRLVLLFLLLHLLNLLLNQTDEGVTAPLQLLHTKGKGEESGTHPPRPQPLSSVVISSVVHTCHHSMATAYPSLGHQCLAEDTSEYGWHSDIHS